jgi:hypothetical protein
MVTCGSSSHGEKNSGPEDDQPDHLIDQSKSSVSSATLTVHRSIAGQKKLTGGGTQDIQFWWRRRAKLVGNANPPFRRA